MRPRLAFQLADLVSTWSRWLRLVYHLGPATNSYRFPVKKQPVMKTAKEWNNLAVAMNECLWKHGRWRRLERRSRKDTISLHLNTGNNEGGYTPVSLLVSKPHPTAGYRPTGKRKRENRGGGCVCGRRETLTDWLPSDLGQSLTLSPSDSGCIVSAAIAFRCLRLPLKSIWASLQWIA